MYTKTARSKAECIPNKSVMRLQESISTGTESKAFGTVHSIWVITILAFIFIMQDKGGKFLHLEDYTAS
jgi:hypothetical protein